MNNVDVRDSMPRISAPAGHPDAGPGHLRRDAGPLALYGIEFGKTYVIDDAHNHPFPDRRYQLAKANEFGLNGVNGNDDIEHGLWMKIVGDESMVFFTAAELNKGMFSAT